MSTIKTRGPTNPTGAVRPLPLPSSRLQSSTGLFRITYCNYSPFFPAPHLAPTDESRCQRGIERSRQLSSDLRPSTDSRIVASCPEHNLGELAFCVYQYTPYAHRVRMNLFFFTRESSHLERVYTGNRGVAFSSASFPPHVVTQTLSPRPVSILFRLPSHSPFLFSWQPLDSELFRGDANGSTLRQLI